MTDLNIVVMSNDGNRYLSITQFEPFLTISDSSIPTVKTALGWTAEFQDFEVERSPLLFGSPSHSPTPSRLLRRARSTAMLD